MIRRLFTLLWVLVCLPASGQAFEIEFVKDKWQLVSFSVLPENSSVENVFGLLGENDDLSVNIWSFNAESEKWATWVPNDGFNPVDDLDNLEVGVGYWVKLNKTITLTIEDGITQSGAIRLKPGWNLIGYTAQEQVAHEQALEGVPFSQLWEFDSASNKFNVIEKSPGTQVIVKSEFTYLKPGKGYWLYAAEEADLLPRLRTLLPADTDIAPLVQMKEYGKEAEWNEIGPGDVDWEDDGYFDFPNTQTHLGFGDFLNRQSIHIENIGNGLLSWSIKIPDSLSWLYIETQDELGETIRVKELNGSTVGIASKVTFLVDRTGMTSSNDKEQGTIQISANGVIDNKKIRLVEDESSEDANLGEIAVSMSVPDIVGDYEITVKLDRIDDKAADLHQPKYFLSMARDGALKGFLDPERSLLVPELTYLSGHFIRDPAGHFQMTGSVIMPSGEKNPMNPFNREIKREFSFVGQRSDGYDGLSPLDLKGAYAENVYGLKGEVIQLSGTFLARRINALPKEFDSVEASLPLEDAFVTESTVEFPLTITDNVSITDIKLLMSLEHIDTSALKVWLQSPQLKDESGNLMYKTVVNEEDEDGEEVTEPVYLKASIHDGASSSVPLINKQYDNIDLSVDSLDMFNGLLSKGTWTLIVENQSTSVAELTQFQLKITGPEVYTLTGQLTGEYNGYVSVRLEGCGISQVVKTDSEGNFKFDQLIPCDYQISIEQLGYQPKSIHYQLLAGETCPDFTCEMLDTSALEPALLSDTLLVTPAVAALPVTITAMDLEFASGVERIFELYKKVAEWWSIQDIQNERVLALAQSGSEEIPPGGNYIAYSETPEEWHSSGVTLVASQPDDPRNLNEAVFVTVDDQVSATILNSQNMGEGVIPAVQAGEKLTLSIFAKPNEVDDLIFEVHSSTGILSSSDINISSASLNSIAGLQPYVYSTPLDNGWYRVSSTIELADKESGIYFVIKAKTTTNGDTFHVFGPQAEYHKHPKWLTEDSVATTSVYAPLYESGYVATQDDHKSTLGEFDFSNEPVQTIVSTERKVNFATLGGEENAIIKTDAGLYQVRMTVGSEIRTSSDVSLYHRDSNYAYFASTSFHASSGSFSDPTLEQQDAYKMDTASFDIDRAPLSEAGEAGLEDSDHFTNAESELTDTNELCSAEGFDGTAKGTKCVSNQIDEPVGKGAHYRMYSSFGQPVFGGSLYGELSPEKAEDDATPIRLDVGIQSQTEGSK